MSDSTITKLSVLQSIDEAMQSVTDAMLIRTGAKMDPMDEKKDKPLGRVHDEAVKRLYCVKAVVTARAVEAKSKIMSGTLSEQLEGEINEEAYRWKETSQLAAKLFWTQVRQDMNYWVGNIGIRRDWMAVAVTEEDSLSFHEVIARALGLD